MEREKKLTKKLVAYFVAALFLSLFSFGVYSLVTAIISFGAKEGWDGYTIATSFSKGNGSLENPYVIHDAPEFMYFKELIEGNSFSAYQDKYYVLDDDIDFNGNAITPIGVVEGEEERFFAGHLNGNGYAITNFKIEDPAVMDGKEYYSLFTKTIKASISSLGMTNYHIQVEESNLAQIIAPFIGEMIGEEEEEIEEEDLPSCRNLYFHNFYIDLLNLSEKEDTLVSTFIGNVVGKELTKNVFIKGQINGDANVSSIYFASNNEGNEGNIYNIITSIKTFDLDDTVISYNGLQNVYLYEDGSFYFREEEVATDTMLAFLNDDIDTSCYWTLEDDALVIYSYEKARNVPDDSKGFTFSLRSSPDVALHDSGVEGSVVYVNDLTADYNYYMGLNYTQSSNGSISSGNNQNLYSSSNLAKVYMAYRGHPIDDTSITGRVSNTDTYTDFVYYKYYPVVNGKVKILLIDLKTK